MAGDLTVNTLATSRNGGLVAHRGQAAPIAVGDTVLLGGGTSVALGEWM